MNALNPFRIAADSAAEAVNRADEAAGRAARRADSWLDTPYTLACEAFRMAKHHARLCRLAGSLRVANRHRRLARQFARAAERFTFDTVAFRVGKTRYVTAESQPWLLPYPHERIVPHPEPCDRYWI